MRIYGLDLNFWISLRKFLLLIQNQWFLNLRTSSLTSFILAVHSIACTYAQHGISRGLFAKYLTFFELGLLFEDLKSFCLLLFFHNILLRFIVQFFKFQIWLLQRIDNVCKFKAIIVFFDWLDSWSIKRDSRILHTLIIIISYLEFFGKIVTFLVNFVQKTIQTTLFLFYIWTLDSLPLLLRNKFLIFILRFVTRNVNFFLVSFLKRVLSIFVNFWSNFIENQSWLLLSHHILFSTTSGTPLNSTSFTWHIQLRTKITQFFRTFNRIGLLKWWKLIIVLCLHYIG